ncbi:MAG: hypothetical protein QME13_08145 [Thermoanaerobacteraceae bacterium]|nr:hypothetical protein [Thermoanaerobacteraceae bacterium]
MERRKDGFQEIQAEKEVSRVEKILALALCAFLLLGGLRLASNIDHSFPYPDYGQLEQKYAIGSIRQELDLLRAKERELAEAVAGLRESEVDARAKYEFAREEYRTLLERGTDDPLKREKWERSREALEAVQAQREQAEGTLKVFTQRVLAPKEKELNEAEQQRQEEWNRLSRIRDIKAGTACLGYTLGAFAAACFLFGFLQRNPRFNRFAIIGSSILGFAALQLLVVSLKIAYPFLRGVVPVEWVVSVGGSGICIIAIIYLRRRLFSVSLVKRRRLWKGECAVCGFSASGAFCAWCGTALQTPCPQCGQETGVFYPFCRVCGSPLEGKRFF